MGKGLLGPVVIQKKLSYFSNSRKDRFMKRFPPVCVIILFFIEIGICGASAKSKIPTGEEIAVAAKAVTLNRSAAITGKKDSVRLTLTPVSFSKMITSRVLEKGQVVALLEATGVSDLPNGKYAVFLMKSNGQWLGVFESGGKIVARCTRVRVSSTNPSERRFHIQTPTCFCSQFCLSGPPPQTCIAVDICRMAQCE
jgi:hypothetical protein